MLKFVKILAVLFVVLPNLIFAADRKVEISSLFDWDLGITVVIEDTNRGNYVECAFYDENNRTLGKLNRFSERFSTEADVVTDGRWKAADVKFYRCVEYPPCEGCYVPD